jgi:hypothetical protein
MRIVVPCMHVQKGSQALLSLSLFPLATRCQALLIQVSVKVREITIAATARSATSFFLSSSPNSSWRGVAKKQQRQTPAATYGNCCECNMIYRSSDWKEKETLPPLPLQQQSVCMFEPSRRFKWTWNSSLHAPGASRTTCVLARASLFCQRRLLFFHGLVIPSVSPTARPSVRPSVRLQGS